MTVLLDEKIYSAMRSLYRFVTMKQGNYPEVIIENEKVLLKKRFSDLEAEDIHYIVNNWEQFFKHERIDQELKDEIMFNEINKEFKKLN